MSVPLSIVICTRNRVDSLRQCVQALACIKTDYEWELVIVDNGSNDSTRAFLASLSRRINNANVITTFEPKRGLAAARNKGLSKASGDVVAFTDDDCYVSRNYVDAMISSFQVGSEIGFIGGRILLYDQSDLENHNSRVRRLFSFATTHVYCGGHHSRCQHGIPKNSP